MKDPKFKVIAELRDDLTKEQLHYISDSIQELENIYEVAQYNANLYCKVKAKNDYSDFGAVAFFYCNLKDNKAFFKKLAYYDLLDGETDIAV